MTQRISPSSVLVSLHVEILEAGVDRVS